jgi:hypothetical protein
MTLRSGERHAGPDPHAAPRVRHRSHEATDSVRGRARPVVDRMNRARPSPKLTDMLGGTTRRVRFAAALMIDIDARVEAACSEVLVELGYRVELVPDSVTALRRIPVLQPLLVVASAKSVAGLTRHLQDVTTAVGGQVLVVPPHATVSFLSAALKRADGAKV